MKNFILLFLLLVLIGELTYLIWPKKSSQKILAEKTAATILPTAVPTPVPTATPTVSSTPKPTKKPTPSPAPQPKFSPEQVNGFVDRFAGQYGVDPNVMRHIALCESGFNPSAYNAGYAGLFQFGSVTWSNLRKRIGENSDPDLRYNAEEAAQTAAYALSLGESGIWPNCHP